MIFYYAGSMGKLFSKKFDHCEHAFCIIILFIILKFLTFCLDVFALVVSHLPLNLPAQFLVFFPMFFNLQVTLSLCVDFLLTETPWIDWIILKHTLCLLGSDKCNPIFCHFSRPWIVCLIPMHHHEMSPTIPSHLSNSMVTMGSFP